MDRRCTICAIRCSYATRSGDRHLTKFRKTALGNPALRALLWRAGLEQLKLERRSRLVRRADWPHNPSHCRLQDLFD
jgi:hypothetical protein